MVGTCHNPEGSRTSDDKIRRMIHEEVAAAIRAEIPKMVGSIKTTLIDTFDERYVVVTEVVVAVATADVVVARLQGGDSLLFREFSNTNPPEFDGTHNLIVAMRWISDIAGCFYTCSCPDHLRVWFALNHLRLGAKDWWKFVTASFTPTDHAVVTYERFVHMFRYEYVPPVERERLAQEFMSLKQRTESVTEISTMFHEMAMFCSEHVSTEQARVIRFLSILGRDIREFVANSSYRTLGELQANTMRRNIELELHAREEEEFGGRDRRPVQS